MAMEEPSADMRRLGRAPAIGWWGIGLFFLCLLGILGTALHLEQTGPTVERSTERLQSLRAAATERAAQCADWERRMSAASLTDQAALFCACSSLAAAPADRCAERLLTPHAAVIRDLTASGGSDPALAARAVRCEAAHGADLPARLACIAEAR